MWNASAGAGEPPDLLGDAVHIDGEADAPIADQSEAKLLLPHHISLQDRPDRQMIRSLARAGAVVDPAIGDAQLAGNHDPVELRDGAADMEARSGLGKAEIMAEIAQAARLRAPLVQIAHQHGRAALGAGMDMRQNGMRLPPAPQPRQIQMHAHHAHRLAIGANIRHHRAARLQRRQMDRLAIDHHRILADEERVAMPPHAAGVAAKGDGFPGAVFVEQVRRDDGGLCAEASIRLLQRDDIGIDLAEHVEDAPGIATPVEADPLVHVVGGDLDHVVTAQAFSETGMQPYRAV